MEEVAKEKLQADTLKASIAGEEAIVRTAKNEANAIKEECEAELSEAMPALRAAEDAVKLINKN